VSRQSPRQSDEINGNNRYVLRLYITGATHHSMLAVKNIKAVCEQYLQAGYSLKIIDVYQQPQLAAKHDIIAAPTLIKLQPLPIKRLVGDLSNTGKVLSALDIVQEL
jgi:circadian clock protein KaiB